MLTKSFKQGRLLRPDDQVRFRSAVQEKLGAALTGRTLNTLVLLTYPSIVHLPQKSRQL